MKSSRLLTITANAIAGVCILMGVCSCNSAHVSGILKDAPKSEVIVKLLNINTYEVLDTLKTNVNGAYRYNMKVLKGQPEFVYLFYKDTKIASLLLLKGDRVKVSSDTLGNYTVTGSEESIKLQQVEKDFGDFVTQFSTTSAEMDGIDPESEEGKAIRAELSKEYVNYYRSRLSYIMANSHSLTCVPVLFQRMNENFPIFSQQTDALHFQNICDSLKSVYPDSKYVKALEKEALRRQQNLSMSVAVENAPVTGFPEIDLPDINAKKVKLSDVHSKVVLVCFWTSTDADQKMFNKDVLLPLYNTYHDKGLEIYAVAMDTDKASWASVVKNQAMPWINVCDSRGADSNLVRLYNLDSIPKYFIVKDGALDNPGISNESTLRKYLSSVL